MLQSIDISGGELSVQCISILPRILSMDFTEKQFCEAYLSSFIQSLSTGMLPGAFPEAEL